ncbi:hypothetical protein EK21DRAFT_111065 [Setomelanomma holmii]|uniref:Uncharacterized protein n=1 Tax=Setomelanomma holmii TaxID=210430 RepID=A0A9P4HAA4_9PLEO|nr:hypothetical protein EK21DRAFT_111065 [Setomelanomma holmii]
MATTSTIAPSAAKQRGRPKKVVAGNSATTTANRGSLKSATTKGKTAEPRKTPARTTAKQDAAAPQSLRTTHTTPIPPQSSPIIQAVKAKGTFGNQPKTPPTPSSASIPDPISAQSSTQSPPPSTPLPASSTQTTIPQPPKPQPQPRTTTIPLPRSPLRAPSPHSLAKPATIPTSRPPPPPPRTRVIEPTPDIRLPPKYKPAARRVTAIIVGIPIIIVVGVELYGRWKGEVRKKWGEGGERV